MRDYFCGWYYRCQSDHQTLALIPSVHQAKTRQYCAIQLITDDQAFTIHFPISDFQQKEDQLQIAENQFNNGGIRLRIQAAELNASGDLRFGPLTPLRYDIMGPFRYVPFLQCRHSVRSMRHRVDGTLILNGTPYLFQGAKGYIEGDRGHSFPTRYAWTQCSFPAGSLMLSIADIPFGGVSFTGVIGVVLLHGKEYRLATYLGAKALKIDSREIIVRQGSFVLTVIPPEQAGHPLQAPIAGDMRRTIHEHPAGPVSYRFSYQSVRLLELDAPDAAFEYEY